MGDRVDIALYESESSAPVVLYSHWDGWQAPELIAKALDRGRSRWDDYSYLTRIIVSQFLKQNIEGLTGYGLSTGVGAGDSVIQIRLWLQTVVVDGIEYSYEETIEEWGP